MKATGRIWRWVPLVAIAVGCPQSAMPGTAHLPQLTTEDPRAEASMKAARKAHDDGDAPLALTRYQRFLADHPRDPLAPLAHLGLGQVLLAEGQIQDARKHFRRLAAHPDPSVAERGRFYDGVALHLAGRPREALAQLKPFVGRTTDPEETALLLRTLAAASEQTNDRVGALEALDAMATAEIDPEDRSEASEKIAEVLKSASPEEIQRAADVLPRAGAAWPPVARAAVASAYENGDMARAHALAETLRAQGLELGEELASMAVQAERASTADPRVVGAILPLSGRGQEAGELALKGLLLAAGSPPRGPPDQEVPRVVFRDSTGDADRAAQLVDELVVRHGVIAIVGPLAGSSAKKAALRAQELGVPLIALSPTAELTQTGSMIFRLFFTPQSETRTLLEAARTRSARRYAVLFPASPFGTTMKSAFESNIGELGGEIVASESYPPGTTSFVETISRIRDHSFDALFLPDTSQTVALIAPALAAAGLWSGGPTVTRRSEGKTITLLVPSVGFDPDLVRTAGRYLQGALFSLPYYAPAAHGASRVFTDEYLDRFGSTPNFYAAFAFDAYRLIRTAVDQGAITRAQLAAALVSGPPTDTAGPSRGFRPTREPFEGTRLVELKSSSFIALD